MNNLQLTSAKKGDHPKTFLFIQLTVLVVSDFIQLATSLDGPVNWGLKKSI
jgi:hypothetical protein